MAAQNGSGDPRKDIQAKHQKPRMGRFFAYGQTALVLAVICWLGWRPAVNAVKQQLARRAAENARVAVMNKDLPAAAAALGAALRWSADDVSVLEASVLYLQALDTNPAVLLRQLLQLQTRKPLSHEQQCLMAHACVSLGKTDEARSILSKLTALDPAAKAALESAILRAEGVINPDTSEMAWQENANSPGSRLKNAMDHLASHFPELAQRARNELWSLATLDHPVAMQAVASLSTDTTLTMPEAQRLLQLVEGQPHSGLKERLQVVSAFMRLQPENRESILTAEIKAFEQGDRGQQIDFARWLSQEKEHEQLIKLLPRKTIAQSPEYYAIVADSMVRSGRWEQLSQMLDNTPPPVPRHLALLWRAEVLSHLQPGLQETRRLLKASMDEAREKADVVTLYKAAEFARKAAIADLAMVAYKATAALSDRQPVELLQNAYEIALQQKNTAELLDISRQLHQLRPASAYFSSRLYYYNLLLGLNIETTAAAIKRMSQEQTPGRSGESREIIPLALLQALVSYRLDDRCGVVAHTAKLKNPQIPPGMRAVAAGLLQSGGKAVEAFQLAEKVHEAVILPEESLFLKMAGQRHAAPMTGGTFEKTSGKLQTRTI